MPRQTRMGKGVQLLWPFIAPYRSALIGGTLICMAGSVLWLVIPWALGQVITLSADLANGGSPGRIWHYLAGIGLASLLYYAALEGARYMLYLVGEKAGLNVHLKTLAATSQARFALDTQVNAGQRLKQITRGSASLNQFFRLYVNVGLDTLVSLTGILIIFAALDPWLILFLILFFILQFVLGKYMTQRGTELAERANEEADVLQGQSFEWLRNLSTVRALGLDKALFIHLRKQRDQLATALRHRIRTFRIRLGLLGINQQLFRLFVLAFCIWQVVEGEFAVGVIAQVYFYFGKIEFTARQFSDLYHRLILIRIDLQTLWPLLAPEAVPDTPYSPYPGEWKQLRVAELTFDFKEAPLFSDMELTIERGEKVGIAGASGSGKSTLLDLLLGMRTPAGGGIYLDDMPLQAMAPASWIAHCGIVMQETELFELSVQENVELGANRAAEGILEEIIKQVGLTKRIKRMPSGLQTILRGPGQGLSGGERQRLGLARALYRQPDLLLLDEVSAHLDAAAEAAIAASLRQLPDELTVVMVAHRLGLLRSMDRILVMDQGKIIESGSFTELLALDGRFAALWEAAGHPSS